MKMILRFIPLLVVILAAAPAAAQWATPNHSVPVGRGIGVIGQGSAGPGASGLPFLGQGASADPVFGQVANGGIAPGGTDTVKGSIDGATVSDLALSNCANQGITYSTATHLFACTALAFGMPVNLQINATVATNNLTIALKANNGTDPSATNPVIIPFRDVTVANGDPVFRSLQTALSFTINSGNAVGCTNAQMCRLWVVAIDNAGTVALCAYNALSGSGTGTAFSVVTLNEGNVVTSASGTNGGASAQTLYCSTSAVTSKPIRLLGYVEVQEATAGTWATAPTFVQLYGPGIPRPGQLVQEVSMNTTSPQTISSTTPATSNMTLSLTPTSAANAIECSATTSENPAAAGSFLTIQMNRSGTALGVSIATGGGGAVQTAIGIGPVFDKPNSTAAQTYAVFVSGNGSNNTTIGNGILGCREIMGMLKPVNDNGLLEMAG
jgi:hypothetical protein